MTLAHRHSNYSRSETGSHIFPRQLDYSIGKLRAGTHTIGIKVDHTGEIGESDEGNNGYTKTIIVE